MGPASVRLPATTAPFAALLVASLLWGTADVAGKLALDVLPPATLAALRFGVALLLFWPLARIKRAPKAPTRIVAPLGVLGVALVFLLQNFGLERTAAVKASMLQGAVPVLTLLFAAALLGERLGLRHLAAVGAALAGVIAVTLAADGGFQAPRLGDLLVLGSAGCFAAFIVLGRRAFPTYGSLSILSGMTFWGTLTLLPAASIELSLNRPETIGFEQIGLVLYLGAGCSALTYALWGFALCHLEAGRAAIFDAVIPIVGVASAVVILREAPLTWHLIGGGLVIAGVMVAIGEQSDPAAVAPARRFARRRAGAISRMPASLATSRQNQTATSVTPIA